MDFEKIEGKSSAYKLLLAVLAVAALLGIYTFIQTFLQGHWSFGTSNRVPWGIAITMVVLMVGLSAGSLMLSTLAYVFGEEKYKPVSRVTVYLAILLLLGALIVIAAEIGRPERSWQLFLMRNPISMFAINGFLYISYFVLSIAYLWSMFKGNMGLTKALGALAIPWAVLVHGGTGAIFGFIASRALWNSAMFPVLFLVAALVSGVGLLILILVATMKFTRREISEDMVVGLGKYLAGFIFIQLFLVAVEGLQKAYFGFETEAVEFLLANYGVSFWIVQVFLGMLLPLAILLYPSTRNKLSWVIAASVLAVLGVFAERFNIVVPGLALPQRYTIEGQIQGYFGAAGAYSPTSAELSIVLGVIALLGLLYALGLKYLQLLPAKKIAT